MAAGEPSGVLEVLEREYLSLQGVRIHQMHAMEHRPSMDGARSEHLRHVSYFLTPANREAHRSGGCDLVPVDFSRVPRTLLQETRCSLVLTAASPPDDDGWCTLGTNAEYVAALIGRAPFFLEINEQMPRTAGNHRIRLDDAVGWYAVDRPLPAVARHAPDDRDLRIADLIAERIPNGATIQLGIGHVPEALAAALSGHRDLGIHSELLSDATMDLIESGVANGSRKVLRPGVAVGTFALGSAALYAWMHDEPRVELHPVDWVNDPRVIAQERCMVSVNATTEVDLHGQCASETVAGRYWSGSGGQADFARGAQWSPEGEAFVALRSTTSRGRSRIRAALTEGSVVTTSKNVVDHIVTEHGVASMEGRTIAQRVKGLIAIADPAARDELHQQSRELGLV
ncbi:MAG: acetyl-CoA hydrolase/transferase family protein [Solirubrobacteraceae bacterium]|nr:acetyl-CoA hydrolase/transferase family protein [Solirubrobacteraceae bacterium]